jgi:hypothetical protein
MEKVRPSILLQPLRSPGQHWLFKSHVEEEELAEQERIERKREQRQSRDRLLLEKICHHDSQVATFEQRKHLAFLQEQVREQAQRHKTLRREEERKELAQVLLNDRMLEEKEQEQIRSRRAFHLSIMQENVSCAENKREQRQHDKQVECETERRRIHDEYFDRRFGSSLR